MGDRLLTAREKRAIRKMPCGKCGAVPPYADGSWTQKHRLKPGSKGGKYTIKNTVPRCPRCHAKEPGHLGGGRSGFILLSQEQRRAAGRARKRRRVTRKTRAKISASLRGRLRPDLRWSAARRATPVPPEVREKISAAMRGIPRPWVSAALRGRPRPPAVREKCRHAGKHRWHVTRGIIDPRCRFCTNS
jgi:hypothetical protein